ncbi:glycoside hydrolase family 28 protein [candidate division KSB1 bacterium]|nr:glycoside hydrolase family 28 protein [candidate division KSB1 bacterium]
MQGIKGRRYILIGIILSFHLIVVCKAQIPRDDAWNQLPDILSRIVPPIFLDNYFLVTNYGAVADGQTDCTLAFRQAIQTCHDAGGGHVVVPKGNFLTGAIHLKSNVNLQLAEGATILFSRDPNHYLPVVFSRWEGVECMNYSPFIYAFEQQNIAITGMGTLDGQANENYWWPWKGRKEHGWEKDTPSQDAARDKLLQMAEDNVPVEQRIMGDGAYLRPQFIQPYRCKNVLIENVTIKNSPMWEIHPVLCENVTVKNVTIISHGPNNDGCDPESSRDVLIKGCLFDTGDDCIAIKSGRNADGRRVNVPSENIVVQDCIMKDGHGGVVIGSEISGNIRNVFAENCTMDSPNLERALRIKTNSVRGGVVENVFMRNVTVGQVADAILRINLNYEEGDTGPYTPRIHNIHMTNVTSQKSPYALRIEGYKRSPITSVIIRDCSFDHVAKKSILKNVDGLEMVNTKVNGDVVE